MVLVTLDHSLHRAASLSRHSGSATGLPGIGTQSSKKPWVLEIALVDNPEPMFVTKLEEPGCGG